MFIRNRALRIKAQHPTITWFLELKGCVQNPTGGEAR
jgi:hypothetical protein